MALPIPDLDDITFAELVSEAVRLIPQYAPEWTDHNPSDPGLTMVELFAWLAEMQIYSLNGITPRHYLKYLYLLGVRPEPAAAAKVWVTFTPPEGVVSAAPAGMKVSAGEGMVFETERAMDILPATLGKVIIFDRYRFFDHSDTNRRSGVFYHAFGAEAPAGAVLYLGLSFAGGVMEGSKLNAEAAGKRLKIKVCLYEDDLPAVPAGDGVVRLSAGVLWKYWNGTGWAEIQPQEEEDAGLVKNFLRSGALDFILPDDMEKGDFLDFGSYFWICAGVTAGGFEIPPRLKMLLLNTVRAAQGESVKEILGVSSGLPGQEFKTNAAPVLAGSEALQAEDGGGGWEDWIAVDGFDASRPDDRHYLLAPDTGKVIFGNGVNGKIPPAGRKLRLSYRSGGGAAGNVGAGAVNLVHDLPGITVTNIFPASGGREAEDPEAAWFRLRRQLKEVSRGVTAADYEHLAVNTPGLRVARAKAVPVPGMNVVKMVVVPFGFAAEPVPGSGFLQTVREHLHRRRLITTLVEVVAPRYVRVSVSVVVRAVPGSAADRVREAAVEALNDFLHPLKGGPGGTGWEFGREVHSSELYALLTGVDGADCVTDLVFTQDGQMDETSLVSSGRHTVEVTEPETACGGNC